MKINKELKSILNILSNCPAMYSQNIKHKNFEHIQTCYNEGLKVCGTFTECPNWDKRINCWKWLNDIDDRFNER